MKYKLAFVFLLTYVGCANAVVIRDESALRDLIIATNGTSQPIFVQVDTPNGVLIITEELPAITGNLFIIPASPQGLTIRPSDDYSGPFVTIADRGRVRFGNGSGAKVKIRSFTNSDDGGAITVEPFAKLFTNGVEFENTKSDSNGGAVTCEVNSECYFSDTNFTDCDSGASGGAVNCLGKCDFENVTLDGNSADDFACGVNAPFGSQVNINQCSIRDINNNCDTNFFDVNGGNLIITSCHVVTDNDSPFASCTGQCDLTNNIFQQGPPPF